MTEMKGLPPPVEVYPEAGGPSLADLCRCAPRDREWYWAMAWGYLVAEHGVGVPAEFLEHARAQGFRPAKLSAAELIALVDIGGSATVPPP